MASPTPLNALVGGLAIPVAAHELLLLNGNVYGISGFIHRAIKGSTEAMAGVAGLILGGALVARMEGHGPASLSLALPKVLVSGFLVGLGTKMANGCTSGHMVCGISRFSIRSIVATATFFTVGVLTTQLIHQDFPAAGPTNWSIGAEGYRLLALQAIPLSLSVLLYALNSYPEVENPATDANLKKENIDGNNVYPNLRVLAYLTTSVQFAFALRLSNLSEASRVISFLLLPFHSAFDPSLALVGAGALGLGVPLYRYFRGDERPRLGGKWAIPKGGKIDSRLLIGSAIFGVGWGMAGICPGPGLVNFGRALGSGGQALAPYAGWLASMVIGGLFA